MSNLAAAGPSDESSHSGIDDAPLSESNVLDGRAMVRADMPRAPRSRAARVARVFGVVGMSLGSHMALLGILGFMPQSVIDEPKQVEMEIVEPPPPPPAAPEPEPEAKPEPEPPPPEPAPKPKLVPKIAAAPKAAPEPTKAEPPPAAEAPVDLTGLTLTGGDSSWTSVVGNGTAMTGPAARIGKVTGRDRAGSQNGVEGGQGTGPALVGEASLLRALRPPDGMDALLEQFFPPRARAQGVSGSALLRVRVQPDGRVGETKTLRETGEYGFGAACAKALKQSRWQSPLDKRGQPVATEIRYLCEFEVSY